MKSRFTISVEERLLQWMKREERRTGASVSKLVNALVQEQMISGPVVQSWTAGSEKNSSQH